MLHSKIDLNLFLVLKTVFQEGTITAAASKLHLTQPAVSHSLSRLREKFDDPLFIRHGRKMVPSAFCQKIIPQVIEAVAALESTLTSDKLFNIGEHKREINLGFRDILESIFFPTLVTDLITNTPNITINSRQVTKVEMEKALDQRDLDIVIDVLTPTSENINSTLVCNERFSLICRENHPILDNLTLDSYAEASHALVALKDSKVDLIDMALAKHGKTRKIALKCEHYFAATSVISRCDMLLTMPNSYANLLKEKMPVHVTQLPFEIPVLPVHMYWHKQAEHDPVNGWMREKLLNIAKVVL
jgi:DNA-binding transcriptional LysR family regulator